MQLYHYFYYDSPKSKHRPPVIDGNSTQASYLVAGEYNRPSSLLTARPGFLLFVMAEKTEVSKTLACGLLRNSKKACCYKDVRIKLPSTLHPNSLGTESEAGLDS